MYDLTFKTSDGCNASVRMVIVSAGSAVFNGMLRGSAKYYIEFFLLAMKKNRHDSGNLFVCFSLLQCLVKGC